MQNIFMCICVMHIYTCIYVYVERGLCLDPTYIKMLTSYIPSYFPGRIWSYIGVYMIQGSG